MNKIVWKKWVSPIDKVKKAIEDDDEDEEELTPWERKERDEDNPKAIKLLMGPNGVIPLGGSDDISKEFNLWVGHTNFSITPIVVRRVLMVPGVEVFKPLTPYRFRLAIAKLFNGKTVRNNIEYSLGLKVPPPETFNQVLDKIKIDLNKNCKFWAICINPKSQIKYFCGETQDQVSHDLESYKQEGAIVHKSF